MDRRINKTKQVLKETLTSLIEEKELHTITVKELTDRANINRGTFYLHYLDIYDMVEKLEQDLMTELLDLLQTNTTFNSEHYFLPVLLKAIELLRNDMRFCKALISSNGDANFLNRIKETMINQTVKIYKKIIQLMPFQEFIDVIISI